VFDKLANGQAVMHCSRHRLTASVVYVTTLTYASTNDQWARAAFPLVSSPKTKPCQFSSVTSLGTRLYGQRQNSDCSCVVVRHRSVNHSQPLHSSSYSRRRLEPARRRSSSALPLPAEPRSGRLWLLMLRWHSYWL